MSETDPIFEARAGSMQTHAVNGAVAIGLAQLIKLPFQAASLLLLPRLLTPVDYGVYAMVERGLLPGVTRIGRRVLVRRRDLLDWLDHNGASSLEKKR